MSDNFYCSAPWRGLHITPQGNVKTCCAGKTALGNLDTDSISNLLNSQKLIEIRQYVSQGRKHEYCTRCINSADSGADGERRRFDLLNPNFDYMRAGDYYHYPTVLDVRWNITCNLSCNYCGPNSSSKWATFTKSTFKSGTREYYPEVCNFISQQSDHIVEVALVGGEPLLLPENEKLLDVIPDNATISVITNLGVDLENNKVFKKLAQRTKVGWSVSFDNIGPKLEYVRYGNSWELLQHNLSVLKKLTVSKGHWIDIHAVYNLYNATNFTELRLFAEENNVPVVWQQLFSPESLNPFLHSSAVARLATQEITKFYSLNIATETEQIFFDQALLRYQASNESLTNAKFIHHNKLIESQIHSDQQGKFAELWPELKSLLEVK